MQNVKKEGSLNRVQGRMIAQPIALRKIALLQTACDSPQLTIVATILASRAMQALLAIIRRHRLTKRPITTFNAGVWGILALAGTQREREREDFTFSANQLYSY